jgi:hypothetical protein
MTVVFAPEKPTKAGNQPHHLTQGWRCISANLMDKVLKNM